MALPLASNARHPRSFSDWSLEAAIALDRHYPSFIAYTCYASDLRRQVIFAALAEFTEVDPHALAARFTSANADLSDVPPQAIVARALAGAPRARAILKALYGTPPAGLLGTLKRLGPNPLPDPDLYRLLHGFFARPEHRQRAKVLGQIAGQITARQIQVLHRLDPVLVHPKILKRVYQLDGAEDANAALALVRATVSTATDAALHQSIDALKAKADIGDFFGGWLERMDRPVAAPPIPLDDPDFEWIASGEALRRTGRLYRNCLSTRVAAVAATTQTFLAWRHGPVAIAELRRLSTGGYVLTQVHGNRNRSPDPKVARAIRRKLEGLGIPALTPGEGGPRLRNILRMTGIWDVPGDLGFDEEDNAEDADEAVWVPVGRAAHA